MADDFNPPGNTETGTIKYNGQSYNLTQFISLFSTDINTDPFINTTFANLLYTSGYFDSNTPFETVGRTLWRRVGEWAITQTKKNPNFVLNENTLASGIKSAATSSTKLGDFGGYLKEKGGAVDITQEKLARPQVITALKEFAFANGIVISVADLNTRANAITGVDANGKIVKADADGNPVPTSTLADTQNYYRTKIIAPKYAQFADDIRGGADVKDLAHDYISMISDALEIDPEKIDLAKDPLLSKALLGYAGKDGKTTYPNYTDFQKMVRQDSRWQYTSNAKDAISSTVQSVKQIFGL